MDNKNSLTVPMAIVIAGLVIGGSIFLSGKGNPNAKLTLEEDRPAPQAAAQTISLPAVSEADHILGNPNAQIVVVEYSDTECPFCKNYHATMHSLINEYGKSGQVAWVYRQMPLKELHRKAQKEAEATECAAELGGNAKFWEYIDRLFEVTPSNDGLDMALLPQIATQIGIDRTSFENCLESGRYTAEVEKETQEGARAGATGTPYSVMVLAKPLSSKAVDTLSNLNYDLLRQLPPGSRDPIGIDATKQKISIGGAFQLPLMRQIIGAILGN